MIKKYERYSKIILCFAFITALLLFSGCAKKELPTAPTPAPESVQSIKLSADRALREENYERAATLYRRLLDQPELPRQVRQEALQGLSASAIELGHYLTALDALEDQAKLQPAVQDDWQWHERYIEVLRELDRNEQVAFHLKTLAPDPARPPEVRYNAGMALARLLWQEGKYDRAVLTLEGIYEIFENRSDKARFEQTLAAELQEVPPEDFKSLTALVTPENEIQFPFSIIRTEQARRLAQNPDTWPRAWRILARMSESDAFAGKNLAEEMLEMFMEARGRPGGGIALVIPLTGPYSEIGWKIARGAGAAQWQMVMSGAQMQIKLLNSEAPDLADRIKSLSPTYAIIGGPLRTSIYKKIKSAGLTSVKPFFAFMSGLPDGGEGSEAWRFFSSPKDEADALIDLAVNELNLSRLGLLYPEEPFGHRMADVFRTRVAEKSSMGVDAIGVSADPETVWSSSADNPSALPLGVSAQSSYSPSEPTEWGNSVAEMLGVSRQAPEDEITLPPEPQFEAVFLPDGWSNAELMIPHFYFFEEDRLLFMGPALWSQGLKRDNDIEMRYYRLAVFPGAFWTGSDSPGTAKLLDALNESDMGTPDLWVALGYDFVRFAANLGEMPSIFEPEAVNELLARAPLMDWSIAPIAWNERGEASQELFLFTPSESGMRPVDPDRLYARLMRVRERHEERVQKLMEKKEMEEMRELQGDETPSDSPVEEPLSPEEREVQNRLDSLADSLEQRENSEQQ